MEEILEIYSLKLVMLPSGFYYKINADMNLEVHGWIHKILVLAFPWLIHILLEPTKEESQNHI